ncbi:MAG: TraB/GumN family protein [Roseovarius sp.]
MRFILAALMLALTPAPLLAACEGTDLIKSMPLEERMALRARATAQPHDVGLLHRATRGDTVITWFGTYHFQHDLTQAHLEAVKPFIETAEAVYLEVSTDDTARMQTMLADDPSLMFITEGPTLPDLLGEDDWQTYRSAMIDRAFPGFMAAKFKPMWAAMMLGVGPCEARAGAMTGQGIDERIGLYAAQVGNTSQSLEDFTTLLTMLDSFPLDEQLDMIRLFFTYDLDADDMAYTLRERYLAQDIAMIWEFSEKISEDLGGSDALEDFAKFEEMLLTRRNIAWVELLLERAEGKQVFAAVGAAHLPGEVGVLHLLEQEGFAIEMLPFEP